MQREFEHTAEYEQQATSLEQQAAELQAARNGLQELTLLHEKLKLRLARMLRQQYGASSEKLRSAIDQLQLTLGDIEEQLAELTPPAPEQPAASSPCRPLPATSAAETSDTAPGVQRRSGARESQEETSAYSSPNS